MVLGARKANCEGLLSVLSHCASAQRGGNTSLYCKNYRADCWQLSAATQGGLNLRGVTFWKAAGAKTSTVTVASLTRFSVRHSEISAAQKISDRYERLRLARKVTGNTLQNSHRAKQSGIDRPHTRASLESFYFSDEEFGTLGVAKNRRRKISDETITFLRAAAASKIVTSNGERLMLRPQ